MKVICRKWTKPVLELLAERTCSFTELKTALGISSRVLSSLLKELQEAGLLHRELKENRRTFYKLTERGKRVIKLLKEIENVIQE